jgi:hypothetical protein
MTDVPVTAGVEDALAECLRRGLEIRSRRQLAGRPGSHHYHLALPGKPGTLELSEWQGEVWFSVNERRDCGWVTDFARTTAAALAAAGKRRAAQGLRRCFQL